MNVLAYTQSTVAVPPTIPTSFVPKQPVSPQLRKQKQGINLFLIIGTALLILSGAAAGMAFGYERYLESARDSKAEEIAQAQREVNINTVEGYLRLRDRLNASSQILDQHVELSEFFDALEARTLQSVRFSSLTITVDADRVAEIQMEGTARTFNALAAQSNEFAQEKQIKRAIFSGITTNENGTVGFSLTAVADPRLITAGEVLPGIRDTEPAVNVSPSTAPATTPAPQPSTGTTTTQ